MVGFKLGREPEGEGEVRVDTCFTPTVVLWRRVSCTWCTHPATLPALSRGLAAERSRGKVETDLWAGRCHSRAHTACTNTLWYTWTLTDVTRERKRATTHQRGGTWWGRFLWACRAWGGSRWRRILPQLLTGRPSAGRAGTAWLSVSPGGPRTERKVRGSCNECMIGGKTLTSIKAIFKIT